MKDDLIRRGKIGNDIALYMAENAYLNDTALDVLKMIAKWVDEQPAVDAVEVVRCRDCKYWLHETAATIDHYECGVFCDSYGRGYLTGADDFCSYGERRKDDGEIQKETR